eukprot:scaffold7220_cov14-Tisochrysis_lutea.AAC.1
MPSSMCAWNSLATLGKKANGRNPAGRVSLLEASVACTMEAPQLQAMVHLKKRIKKTTAT